MKSIFTPLLSTISSSLLLFCSNAGLAQSSPHEGWYEVEVIVFARPLSSDERWPEDITLDYPLNWEALKDPEADYRQRLEQAQQAPQEQRPTDYNDDTNLPTADTNTSQGQSQDEQQARLDAVEPVDLARSERYRLPQDTRKLNALERRINAQPGYRVLFHEAWRQFVTGKAQAPWIIIEGGESYGEHRELEGSLNINVARYLHMHTDLWFTEFQINTGQSHRQWPSLPESPEKRLHKAFTSEATLSAMDLNHSQSGFGQDNTMFSANNMSGESTQSSELDTLLNDFLDAPYIPRRIYTLDQRRRMRSTELHYLDHPRLGLLIKILPYELPPEEEATEPESAAQQEGAVQQ
ncbi:peptidoglycan binding protein CsiV [Gilvimarinus agarilyticus]|uniref:CsiV family protein n=1 Tax=Gilvimarinus sp. 2_MG-2023 TaxID=3062666 RepID=UPI001C093361|nr:CsiV family protein [Gilvimarinus sp. 2_MG-2023]MBU2885136.1 peptidoglycan binding protein CsiV [Gilvimarinus agarilyticus]MDO6570034.1 CsiV family protein [Gilvimarinus sp. 2_MG-2023]